MIIHIGLGQLIYICIREQKLMAYDDLKDRLHNVAFTTATPFSDDGAEVLHEELASNLRSIQDRGAEVFIPCGNTGEYYALSHEEREAVVKTHVEVVGDDGIVVGGVAGSTKTAISLIDRYEAVGADAVLVMHPDHTHMHERGLVQYYRRLSESTDLGIVGYKRGTQLSTSVLCGIAGIENVIGIKYADKDIKDFKRAVEDVPADLVWINGIAERYAVAFAIEGADGYTTGIGNFVPEATLALFDAIENGNWEAAHEYQRVLRPYEDLREESGVDNDIPSANNVPAVKYGLELAGLCGGPVREPLVQLSETDKARADDFYRQIEGATLTIPNQ